MQLKTLESTSIADLTTIFNEAFSDYIIPLHLTKEQLLNKIVAEGIDRKLSVGAFENDKLVGFILHGVENVNGEKSAYNAGTGVIPSMRGNKITARLYDHAFPLLKKYGVRNISLEVIAENTAAKKTYLSIGFTKKRTLNCYKGSITELHSDSEIQVQNLYQPDWKTLETFWDWKPSWQNSVSAVNKSWSLLDTIGIFSNNNLVGYAIYNPKLNRILQFAIDKDRRKSGFGKQLFKHYSLNKSKTVSMNNIDADDVDTNAFLTATGLNLYLQQEEMQIML